jgi:hypothetical protein
MAKYGIGCLQEAFNVYNTFRGGFKGGVGGAGTPLFDHHGDFPPFFTTTNISASDLVQGDHALGI